MARFLKQAARRPSEENPVGRPDDLLPLVRAIAGGDGDAAATLIAHVGGPMLNVVRRVLGSGCADVDDVAQEAVIALLTSLTTTFRGECSVMHFGNRVALLTALAARRRLGLRHRQSEALESGAGVSDSAQSPLATTVAGQRRRLVRQLLDGLPDVIAESLAMHFMLGYTVEEIASAASVSPNTVWSRLRLGKQALRRMLQREDGLAELLEVSE